MFDIHVRRTKPDEVKSKRVLSGQSYRRLDIAVTQSRKGQNDI